VGESPDDDDEAAMTTTDGTLRSPHPGTPRVRPVVVPVRVALRSLVWGPAALVLLGAATWALLGSATALGLVAGGALALLLLVTGTLVVAVAASVDPRLSLLVAVTTFALHVVLAGVVFYAVTGAPGARGTFSVPALAVGLLVVAFAWTVAQVVALARARIPVYDLPAGATGVRSERQEAGAP
jgi:ATP synthase protein I